MKILFHGYEKLPDRHIGWGDAFMYLYACYLEGKRKGYKDKEIYIVFPRIGYDPRHVDNIKENSGFYQPTKYLPWNNYSRVKIIEEEEWDELVDTSEIGSLYPSFPGINRTGWYIYIYFDIYKYITGNIPHLDLPKTHKGKPYILFHYRGDRVGAFHKERETPINEFDYIFNIIKEHLGDKYEYWKIGEISDIDDKFDKVIPYMYGDLDGFMELLCNSSMLVGSHAGPSTAALLIKDLPVIRFGMIDEYNTLNPRILRKEIKLDFILKKYGIDYTPSYDYGNHLSALKGNLPKKKDILELMERFNL